MNQLIQDKICKLVYKQNDSYCLKVSNLEAGGLDDPKNLKILILTKSAEFNLYLTLLSTVPSIFWCIFLGSWCIRMEENF